jgi:hypothetical protein
MSGIVNKLIIFASKSDESRTSQSIVKIFYACNQFLMCWMVGYNKNNIEFETVVENNYRTHNPLKGLGAF